MKISRYLLICASVITVLAAFVASGLLSNVTAGPTDDRPASGDRSDDGIPDHPKDIQYPEQTYSIPSSEGLRYTLDNGIVLWWAEDKGVAGLPPLFHRSARIGAGTREDPADKSGLSEMSIDMMRDGGTAKHTRDELNRQLELRAASVSTAIDTMSATVSLSCLHDDRELCIELWDQVLRAPAFNTEDIERARRQWAEALKNRNDSPSDVESREWKRLLFGDHPVAAEVTRNSLDAITREDMQQWHQANVQPQNIMLHGSGGLTGEQAVALLNKLFINWESTNKPKSLSVQPTRQVAKPGIYLMHREQEQAHLRIGQICYQREMEDYFAMSVMNYILGGGSFSSRITSSVRVDHGLSYVAGSHFERPDNYRGFFIAYAQTENATVALAARLMLDEIKRIRDNPVSPEELHMAKEFFKGSFPQYFSTRNSIVRSYALIEFLDRPEDYYATWVDHMDQVTAADVQRVAKKYLDPDNLVVYVLGDAPAVRKGNTDETDESMRTSLEDLGMPITEVPLPEPENLTVPKEEKDTEEKTTEGDEKEGASDADSDDGKEAKIPEGR